MISLSRIKHNLKRHDHVSAQIDKVDDGAMKNEAKALTTKKAQRGGTGKSHRRANATGEISPDEAMKKMEAIQNAMLAEIEGSGVANMGFEEPEDPTNYSIQFLDTKEQVQSWPLTGELRIIRFDENVFEATFSGQHYVECRERRAASHRKK